MNIKSPGHRGWQNYPVLDHVMVSLPQDAYRELVESEPVLNQLGRFKLKKADSSLAGLYASAGLAGENTLVEFFDVDRPLFEGVTGGLVFSFEVPGSFEDAAELLRQNGIGEVQRELVRRSVPGSPEQQPWYHLLQPGMGTDSPFALFLSEVTAEYFAHLGAQRGPHGEFPRRAYLDAVLGRPTPDQILADITSVTLAMRTGRASRIAGVLGCLGHAAGGSRGTLVLSAADTEVRITSAGVWEEEGVREIEFRLNKPAKTGLNLSFGQACALRAVPGSMRASWSFTTSGTPRTAGATSRARNSHHGPG